MSDKFEGCMDTCCKHNINPVAALWPGDLALINFKAISFQEMEREIESPMNPDFPEARYEHYYRNKQP